MGGRVGIYDTHCDQLENLTPPTPHPQPCGDIVDTPIVLCALLKYNGVLGHVRHAFRLVVMFCEYLLITLDIQQHFRLVPRCWEIGFLHISLNI